MSSSHPLRETTTLHVANGDHIPPIAARQHSAGVVETKHGTLHVSRPFRSRTSKKLKAMITFTPRKSHFDIENDESRRNEFRVSSQSYRFSVRYPTSRSCSEVVHTARF